MAEERTKKNGPRMGRMKWIIGTPYFVQGTSTLIEIPTLYFIKYTLMLGDAGGQLFDALRQVGWFVKPVWGLISDRVALFGYHRKSWYVVMALLSTVFWTLNALLAFLGISVPSIYLLTFNLAFATYAFVDVVCDALMVTWGRKLQQVGTFITFQWGVLAIANAVSVYFGGKLQAEIEAGDIDVWLVFLITGLPPLVTAAVGIVNIDEDPVQKRSGRKSRPRFHLKNTVLRLIRRLSRSWDDFRRFRKENRLLWLLVLFIFFWKFSPSVGYIERSYLIDVRGFGAESFGLILAVGGLTFFISVLAYSQMIKRFPGIQWYQYLYAMVALGVVAFPLSFYLYLEPDHAWWQWLNVSLPQRFNPLPGWNRYEWFRLIVQTVLGFATIPAFIIPLVIAGETVKVSHAGVGYAFLMSLSNVTNMFEGVIGAGLYDMFSSPNMAWLVDGFGKTPLNIAGVSDERTLILQLFVYIGLVFTLLTIPFIEMLRRELKRRNANIRLGGG